MHCYVYVDSVVSKSCCEHFQKFAVVCRFNASGRGFPDVAAIGDNFRCTFNNKTSFVGGTSAASPTFAAVLSRINNARLVAGKSTLGWVNPRL